MNTPPEAVAAIASFADKLTPTQQTLLQNFPDFRSADEVRDYVAGMRAEIPQREVTAYLDTPKMRAIEYGSPRTNPSTHWRLGFQDSATQFLRDREAAGQ